MKNLVRERDKVKRRKLNRLIDVNDDDDGEEEKNELTIRRNKIRKKTERERERELVDSFFPSRTHNHSTHFLYRKSN